LIENRFRGQSSKSNPWKDRVRDIYSSLEELRAYDRTYGIAGRLGYKSATELWNDNPMISGSVHPKDLRVIRRGERLPGSGSHLPPTRRNPRKSESYTPGPWFVEVGGEVWAERPDPAHHGARTQTVRIADPDIASSGKTTTFGVNIEFEEACANARLIAAAPEMIEMLKEIDHKIHRILASEDMNVSSEVGDELTEISQDIYPIVIKAGGRG